MNFPAVDHFLRPWKENRFSGNPEDSFTSIHSKKLNEFTFPLFPIILIHSAVYIFLNVNLFWGKINMDTKDKKYLFGTIWFEIQMIIRYV